MPSLGGTGSRETEKQASVPGGSVQWNGGRWGEGQVPRSSLSAPLDKSGNFGVSHLGGGPA